MKDTGGEGDGVRFDRRGGGAMNAMPADPRSTPDRRRRSNGPLRLLLVMIGSVFAVEALVMGVISLLPPMATLPEALFDAAALTVLLFPILYFAAFRPLVRELGEHARADSALQRLNEELEARIAERTSQLAQANTALHLEIGERTRSERRYRDLFEHNLAGVYRSTLDGRLLDCNLAFARLYGYASPEELLATPAVALYPEPDARAAFVAALRASRQLLAFECPGRTKDGRHIWLLENVALVPDKDGELRVIEGTAFDITDRKAAEAERERLVAELDEERRRVAGLARTLEYERDILATTMENTRAHLAFLDGEFNFVQVNAAYADGSGRRRDELIGRNHFELFPDAGNRAIFEKVRDSGETIEFRARPFEFPDQPERGVTYWDWTLAPVMDRSGSVAGLVLSLVDVTALIRVEHALRESEKKYRQLVESAQEGVWAIDADARTTFVNVAMAEMLGLSVKEMSGRPLSDFLDEDGRRVLTAKLELRRQGLAERHDFEFVRRDGSRLYASIAANPLLDDSGKFIGVVAMVADITARKQAEEDLRRALADARGRQAEVAALLEGARAVLGQEEFAGAAAEILRSCKGLVGADAGFVALLEGDGQEGSLVAVDPGARPCGIDRTLSMPIRGTCRDAVRERRTAICNDVRSAEPGPVFPAGHVEIENILFAPMSMGDESVGVLALANKAGGFADADSRMASAFGEIAAVALLNSRAKEALQRSRDELEARVEQRTAELARANEALAIELAERRRAEELLGQREQTFRSLTESLPDVVSRFDRGFRHLFVSRQVEAATGLPRDRFLSHTNRELGFSGPLVDLWDRQLQAVFESGEVRAFEFSVGEGDRTTWFESRLVPEFGPDGAVATVLGIARDITVRRRSEEALQRSEQLLRTVLELLPVGVFLLDQNGTIVTGNAAAQRIWAGVRLVGPEDYGAYKAWSMETGEPLSAADWAAARAIREEASVLDQVVEIESFDGSKKVITNSAVPLRGPDGALTGVVVVNEDITEQVEAERSLRRFANEQQALFTVTSAATARLDVERLLDSVLETVLPVMEADAGWVTVIGADPAGPPSVFAHRGLPRDFIEAEASAPLETCAACWPLVQGEPSSPVPWKLSKCARIPRPVCVNTGLHSHVSVTLKAGEAVYGILNVGWKSEHETDRVEHDLLEAIARQVGIALQNAQLYRSEQEARRTAETLRAAGMALTGTLELASVESTLLDSLRELIPYDRARVMLREGDETLVVRATVTGGKPPEIVRDPAPSFAIAGDPILSEILASGKGVVIDDIYSNPHFARRVAPGFERSWMGVPLVAGNQVIGLYSLSKVEPGHFNARHLRLAEALAAPAAMAIQNAWLFEQVRKGHEQLQTLSRRLVEVQENERRAIARELHDEAGQALTSMTIGLGLVERSANDPDAVVARTNELKKTAGSILANLHRLASNLRPATLDHVGLVSALRQYVENLDEASGAVMQFEAVGFEDRRLSSAHETALYRIAQEAVTNVLRHAQATRIAVLLERHGANVVLVVEDNGTGFDEREAASRGRLGLIGMRERAEALGGRMVIESAAGKGTTIVVEVPHGHADPDRG